MASRSRFGPEDVPKLEMRELFNQKAPQGPEAEMALLGCMLLDPNCVPDVLAALASPDDFYQEKHVYVYRALASVWETHQSGDLVQIHQRLVDCKALEKVGGPEYLTELASSVPSAVNWPYYARIVANKARLRRAIDVAGRLIYDGYNLESTDDDHIADLLDEAETKLGAIATQGQTTELFDAASLMQAELERLEAADGNRLTGIPTGFFDLDGLTLGLQRGELIILGARPSMGKSSMALNVIENVALGIGYAEFGRAAADQTVLMFSLEMNRSSLIQRLLASRAGVDLTKVRTGAMSKDEYARYLRATHEFKPERILIDDTPSISIASLRARARKARRSHNVSLIVVDYLQMVTSPGKRYENRQAEVAAISAGLKSLARELDVPVLVVAQLNRASEQRQGNRPKMSDLRESGSIEQDADVIMLLHREDYYHMGDQDWLAENPDQVGVGELIIAKQRNGPTDVVKLKWDPALTKFKGMAPRYEAKAAAAAAAPTERAPRHPPDPLPEHDDDDDLGGLPV